MKRRRKGKVGRPPSGRHRFSVRMLPDTRAELVRFAKKDGHRHLGEWFDEVAVELLRPPQHPAPLKKPSCAKVSSEICEYSIRAANAIAELLVVVERDPLLDDEAEIVEALKRLQQEYRRLSHRLGELGMEV